jgi:hypothetical protein
LDAACTAFVAWRASATWWGGLFFPEPDSWGLRGDPYAWRALLSRLEGHPPPADIAELTRVLHREFADVVGVDLWGRELPEHVFKPEFAHGGMSSGHVDLQGWRAHLMPLLARRGEALLA